MKTKRAAKMVGGMVTDRGIVAAAPVTFQPGDVITTRDATRTIAKVDDYAVTYTNGTVDIQHCLAGLIQLGLAKRVAA